MLVLTCKEGEEVVITCPDGTEVRVVVNEFRVHRHRVERVALAFHAPRAVIIDRLKVHESRRRTQKELTDAKSQAEEVRHEVPPSYHPRPGP